MAAPVATRLEQAALDRFCEVYSDDVPELLAHLRVATIDSRINTGAGLFADILIDRDTVQPLDCPSPLDNLAVNIDGVLLEFLLFFKDGYAHLLEAYAVEGGDTQAIDFETASFGEIYLLHPKRRL